MKLMEFVTNKIDGAQEETFSVIINNIKYSTYSPYSGYENQCAIRAFNANYKGDLYNKEKAIKVYMNPLEFLNEIGIKNLSIDEKMLIEDSPLLTAEELYNLSLNLKVKDLLGKDLKSYIRLAHKNFNYYNLYAIEHIYGNSNIVKTLLNDNFESMFDDYKYIKLYENETIHKVSDLIKFIDNYLENNKNRSVEDIEEFFNNYIKNNEMPYFREEYFYSLYKYMCTVDSSIKWKNLYNDFANEYRTEFIKKFKDLIYNEDYDDYNNDNNIAEIMFKHPAIKALIGYESDNFSNRFSRIPNYCRYLVLKNKESEILNEKDPLKIKEILERGIAELDHKAIIPEIEKEFKYIIEDTLDKEFIDNAAKVYFEEYCDSNRKTFNVDIYKLSRVAFEKVFENNFIKLRDFNKKLFEFTVPLYDNVPKDIALLMNKEYQARWERDNLEKLAENIKELDTMEFYDTIFCEITDARGEHS